MTAVAEHATRLRRVVDTWLRDLAVADAIVDAIVLATYEAMINVVVHAYRGGTGVLGLSVSVGASDIVVTVTDQGLWKPEDHRRTRGGRGLPLIYRLADSATVARTDHGTTVRMSWALPGAQA